MEYLDFDLDIGAGNGLEYPVAVRSPAGETHGVLHFPYDHDKMETRLKDLTIALLQSASLARQVLPVELQSVQDMGKDFFNALFSGDILAKYDVSQQLAQEQGMRLRVRLRTQAGEISALPWEYLYDPRTGEYLCLSTSTPLVRYLEASQIIRPLKVGLPLRVLGMVCSQSDLRHLDFEREKQRVGEALADLQERGLVELTWLSGETYIDLQNALLEGPWHVFHFIGHGDFDKNRDEGYLALTGRDGKSYPLYAAELARLLANHQGLRVVVLNACEGAHSSLESVYSSVAAVLVRRGIACTIAMQFPITNKAAVELARSFYTMLARGLPVDNALTEARKSLSIAIKNSVEWGTPVLFMRSPDGKLFNVADHIPGHNDSYIDERYVEIHVPPRIYSGKTYGLSVLIQRKNDVENGRPKGGTNKKDLASSLVRIEFPRDDNGMPQNADLVVDLNPGFPGSASIGYQQRITVSPDKSSQVAKFNITFPRNGDFGIGVSITQEKINNAEQNLQEESNVLDSNPKVQRSRIFSSEVKAHVIPPFFDKIYLILVGAFICLILGGLILSRGFQYLSTLQTTSRQTAIAGTSIALATDTPTITWTPTITPTPTITLTPEPTSTSTIIPTPLPPEIQLQKLIEKEGQALVTKDRDLIKTIFSPNAKRIDRSAGKEENAIGWYLANFDSIPPDYRVYTKAVYENYHVVIKDKTAVVTDDNCGTYISGGKSNDYMGIQSDLWTFEQDVTGRWWVKELSYNIPLPGSEVTFSFEEKQHACLPWAIRFYDADPQGKDLTVSVGRGYEGSSALRFAFDSTKHVLKRGQIVTYDMPFAGSASAYVYLPPGAPITLAAGFIAQDSDKSPFGFHKPLQYIPLKPGEWTKVTWEVPPTILPEWKTDPTHFVGLEIYDKNEAYKGYVLIDQITIKMRK